MKISTIDPNSLQGDESQPSEVVQRLQQLTQIIGQQRAKGAEEVNMVLRDNDVDTEVISRLSRLYDVQTQNNGGPSVKVNVKFRS
jgi:hypothetical protein